MSGERQKRWRAENPEKVKAQNARRNQQGEYQRRWRAENPEKVKAHRAAYKQRQVSHHTGLTGAERQAFIVSRGAVCAICGTDASDGHVDHDHSTGALRGLLCRACNVGLGFFRDDTARLRMAIEYIERHQALQALL